MAISGKLQLGCGQADCSIFNRFVVQFQIGSVKTAFPGAEVDDDGKFQLSYGENFTPERADL